MCKAKQIQMLNQMGMTMVRMDENRAALILFGRALALAVRLKAPVLEAKVRSNIALVFQKQGRFALSLRQINHAMRLVMVKVGKDNRFYDLLDSNRKNAAEQENRTRVKAA